MDKKLLERFTKKNCKRQIRQSLELEKQLKDKVINYMPNPADFNKLSNVVEKKVKKTTYDELQWWYDE